MPKRLLLIRHAKSSWDEPFLEDHQRPLAQRGIEACALMASYCEDLLTQVEAFYCSTAVRAKQTLSLLGQEQLGRPVMFSDCLYTFDVHELAAQIAAVDNRYDSVAVVGHNPAITDLVNRYSSDFIENVPTAAFVLIVLELEDWSTLTAGTAIGKLEYFIKPKQVK